MNGITVRYTLSPFDPLQVRDYIRHRLAVAGGGTNGTASFSRWAYRMIYRYSRGIPRRINAICDRALLIAYSRNGDTISAQIVREGAHDIGGGYPGTDTTRNRIGLRPIALAVLIIIFLVVVVIHKDPLIEFFFLQMNLIG